MANTGKNSRGQKQAGGAGNGGKKGGKDGKKGNGNGNKAKTNGQSSSSSGQQFNLSAAQMAECRSLEKNHENP